MIAHNDVGGPLYYLPNARSQAQHDEMVELEKAGICIFCPESWTDSPEPEVLLEYPGGVSFKKKILSKSDCWALLVNEYPYAGALQHVMLVPRQHANAMHELSVPAQRNFWTILDQAVTECGLSYYVLGVRNGHPRFTGATIQHLHIQLVVSDPKCEPVKFYMGSAQRSSPPSA
ncbi:MAG TPA: hypothetical protein VLE72_04280 [Candidatus Saccharimonadales bacterium]|nr:hypothetical protein [Candidatus Saccharimonadales bacterium]